MHPCQTCHAELPDQAPGDRCPKCLLELGLTGEDESAVDSALCADVARGQLGERIGRYKLLQQIGEGGCGIVYMAEQEDPVRRRVALKVIKLGMDTKQVVARFEAERQALAMMDHPNIARVFDGGATEQGRPYFVMELVRGIRITQYCDQHELSMADRLELFVKVCQAVQHAHQKGIIHRDLKPSNILVTINDGLAVPKVIDFGVAKATEQRLTDKTIFTRFEAFIGTPAYMSPEQAGMSSLDIDTRSDVYSLGVLLYELLTGHTPFDQADLAQSGMDEMRRTIREKDPPRPSTRLRALTNEELTTTAKYRRAEVPRLISALRGELDWIVMKCLEKDRTRRYETASGLAADLQRHLTDEPIVARPPSRAYRFQKFVRRNKLAFAASMAVLLSLVAGIAMSSWQAVRAGRAEQEQTRARTVAESRLQNTLGFVDRLFREVAPQLSELLGAAKVGETLATNSVILLEQLRTGEESSAEFRRLLGLLYLRLASVQSRTWGNSAWDPEAGLKAAKEAIRLLQSDGSEAPAHERICQLADAEMSAGTACNFLEAFDDAINHFRKMELWATQVNDSSVVGAEARRLKWTAMGGQGWVLTRMGRIGEALTNYHQPRLRDAVAHGVSETSEILDVYSLSHAHKWIGLACLELGRKEEALSHRREALRLMEIVTKRAPNSSDFPMDCAVMTAQLGESLLELYRPEGVDRLKEALERTKSLTAQDPGNAGFTFYQIAVLRYLAQGFTAWAGEASATWNARRDRLDRAQVYLDEADRLVAKFRSESARKAVRFDLEIARAKLAAAKARLDGESGH